MQKICKNESFTFALFVTFGFYCIFCREFYNLHYTFISQANLKLHQYPDMHRYAFSHRKCMFVFFSSSKELKYKLGIVFFLSPKCNNIE